MFTEAQNLAITRTELDTVFAQNFAYDATDPGIATANTGEIFKEQQITGSAWIGEVTDDTGLWPATGETQTVPTATPKVTNKYTISTVDYANSIEISKDLFDDNRHGVWANQVAKFARKARLTQDNTAFGLFRNAFTTQLTPDGVAAISASHVLIGGGTTSNLVTGALSNTTIYNAIVALREQVDQNGVIQGGVPSILLTPQKLWKTATEQTDSALIADSANNALNVYRSAYGFTVWSSPYLGAAAGGSDTAWFMLTRDHSTRRYIRQGIETALRGWQYSNNRSYLYQGNFRESYYIEDYSGLVGSTG